jgi:hypothetical protein
VTIKHIKRIMYIAALVFAVSPFVFAGDKDKETEMTGTVCDQKCVKQDADKAACDLSCTEQSGQAAFVDGQGKAWKVANPAICKGKMGKKAKANVKQMGEPGTLWINRLSIFG